MRSARICSSNSPVSWDCFASQSKLPVSQNALGLLPKAEKLKKLLWNSYLPLSRNADGLAIENRRRIHMCTSFRIITSLLISFHINRQESRIPYFLEHFPVAWLCTERPVLAKKLLISITPHDSSTRPFCKRDGRVLWLVLKQRRTAGCAYAAAWLSASATASRIASEVRVAPAMPSISEDWASSTCAAKVPSSIAS